MNAIFSKSLGIYAIFLQFVLLQTVYAGDKPFLHLTPNQGLSQGYIACIFQDSRGFMWFGTKDGLNRYDGYEFKVYKYNRDDSCSIQNNYVTDLIEDKSGNLWIGTIHGVYHFDIFMECFKPIAYLPNPMSNKVFRVFMDHQGILWIGYDKGILRRYDPNIQKSEVFNYDSHTALYPMFEDTARDYLYLCNHFGFHKTQKIFTKAPQQQISSYDSMFPYLHKDYKNNDILYRPTTNKGLEVINLCTGELEIFQDSIPQQVQQKFTKPQDVLQYFGILTQDDQGIIWKGNEYGLIAFDPKQKRFVRNVPIVGTSNSIISLYIDQSGIIWIGTSGNGVYAFAPWANAIETYQQGENDPNSLSFSSIRTIYEDGAENLWIGGYKGLDMFTPDKKIFAHFINYQEHIISAYDIVEDPKRPEEILWVTADGLGLLQLHKKTQKFTRVSKPDYYNPFYIFDLLVEPNNIIYLGNTQGLAKFNTETQEFKLYQHSPNNSKSIYPGSVKAIYRDRKGMLWVGLESGGIACFEEETETFTAFMHRLSQTNSLGYNDINSFYEDTQGNFWVATNGGGVDLFDRKKGVFKHYTTKDGLPNNVVYGILEDEKGNLWMSTNLGISMFDPVHKTFTNYDRNDGLQGNEFNRNAFYKDKDGKMYFGGVNGVSAFYPEEMKKNMYQPPVVITKFKKFNEEIPLHQLLSPTGVLELSYKDAVISFDFAALSFYNHHKNQYAYKLEGLHEDWINLGNRHTITLTNLSAKNYTLRIKASNNHGVWNEEGVVLPIRVIPPFWATTWFQALLGVLIFGILFVLYSLCVRFIQLQKKHLEQQVNKKTAELKALNQTKDRFFAIIAHDLRGPLASFQELSYLIGYYLESNRPKKIKQLIKHIDQSAKGLHDLLNNLLNWAMVQQNMFSFHPRKVNLKQFIEECSSRYQGSLQAYKINLQTMIPEGLHIWVDYNSTMSIVCNILSNAIKYTPDEGNIELKAFINAQQEVVLMIKDSGIGMDTKTKEQLFDISRKVSHYGIRGEEGSGFGLILCKEFAKLNQATIQVESMPEKGSAFYITFHQ